MRTIPLRSRDELLAARVPVEVVHERVVLGRVIRTVHRYETEATRDNHLVEERVVLAMRRAV